MTIEEALTEPLTIDELLLIGRPILAARRDREQVDAERGERERNDAWTKLRDLAVRTFGEIAEQLPPTPPEDFDHTSHDHLLPMQPFGEAWLTALADWIDGGWRFRAGFDVPLIYSPLNAERSSIDSAEELREKLNLLPAPTYSRHIDTLAEAVAVCEEAGASFRQALAEQQESFRANYRRRHAERIAKREVVIPEQRPDGEE